MWFAGAEISTRCCDGDCSYETFDFPQKIKIGEFQKPDKGTGKYFDCCKTAFRPYDVAVTAFLIIAKHYLKDTIQIESDGEEEQWFDAKLLCQMELGYGLEYNLKNLAKVKPVKIVGVNLF